MMNSSRKLDPLHGSLAKNILLFALPVSFGAILQQLFNAVDTAVVGRFASPQALAAVGSNGPVINLFINLFVGISIGAGVIIARYIGEGNKARISKAVHTAMLTALITGCILLVMIQFFARPILNLIETPDDVIELTVLYLRIYGLGFPFIMLYNFGAAILRSAGDSRRPLNALTLAGVINVFLNLFFVIVCHMSVAGVALATVISNTISSGLVIYYLMTEEEPLRLSIRKLAISRQELLSSLKIGMPAGLQSMVFSISNTCILSSINSFGSSAVAGSAVAVNCEYWAYSLITGFVQATITFTSQNYGARQMDRCSKVWRWATLECIIACMILNSLFLVFRYPLIGLFTTDPKVIPFALLRMTSVLGLQWLVAIYEVGSGSMRGFGQSLIPMLLILFGSCLLRLVWIFAYIPTHHEWTTLMSIYPITWIVTVILVSTARYLVARAVYRKAAAA
ncbi:MAG: MATE family efflux transporter [Lachnospiraceae bacterium]|nr:MATE family efflux transporter [Candidatus Equihabitans merdae]